MPLFDVTRIIKTTTAQRVTARVRAKDREEAMRKLFNLPEHRFKAKEPPVVLRTETTVENPIPKGERYP